MRYMIIYGGLTLLVLVFAIISILSGIIAFIYQFKLLKLVRNHSDERYKSLFSSKDISSYFMLNFKFFKFILGKDKINQEIDITRKRMAFLFKLCLISFIAIIIIGGILFLLAYNFGVPSSWIIQK